MVMFTQTAVTSYAHIQTTVAKSKEEVDDGIQKILSNRRNDRKVIGLDTERTSSGLRGNRLAILQLCDGDFCLIIQLIYFEYELSLPTSLFNFLRLPDYTFVGIGMKESLAKLEKECGICCKICHDLSTLAANVMADPHLAACGVEQLAEEMCIPFYEKPTAVVFDDWGDYDLNAEQVQYATLNAYAYFKIGDKLLG